jgi:hypothetical protein
MMAIDWHMKGDEESKVQILQFFVTNDGSEVEIQRSVELSGECSQRTYTRARVEREIKYIAAIKYLGIKDLSNK